MPAYVAAATSFVALVRAASAGDARFDPSCFDGKVRTREKCCGQAPHAGCLWGAILSHGYCCDLSSECFAWGVGIAGDDVADPMFARSGLECRHLCQAAPSCRGWTFVLPGFPDEELRYSCWLKSRLWSGAEAAAGAQLSSRSSEVVSGSRHCPKAHEEVLVGLQQRRTVDLRHEPPSAVARPNWDRDPGGFAGRAAKSLLMHGWAVVRGAFSEEAADLVRDACKRAEAQLLGRDARCMGNRGPRRYSLGSASKTHHMVHWPEWRWLIDNPAVADILRLVFQGDNYVSIGGGGDLVLGETDSVQWLHVDLPRWEMYDRVYPPPGIGVNFAVHDVGCADGPMRLVPDSHTLPFRLEEVAVHTETAMLERYGLSRVFVCPLQKGDIVLRDLRLWHAGSANLGHNTRHSPNAEFLATWYADATEGTEDHLAPRKVIPEEVWQQLSPQGQKVAERTRALEPVDGSFYDQIGIPQQYD
eukprot:gnl/TRDRNA2_/TRDRNA2_94313_c0_seq1.p1 gnl/TRDRNA2_/TRDRNA2_94313_c0~~gnl/TRDRNA2_/TRDRNA2_94313_c0_seq1.p1  ORF type:complete len:473 (-),score=58.40 gnl/TRDRNA2_/TRDRNA2_94313_c0_seq1:96-1514(-)